MSETITAEPAHAKKKLPFAAKVALFLVGTLVGLVAIVVLVFNLYTRATYSSFYTEADAQFDIPGISSGFICQDLDYYDEGDCWFFSGYATGEGASPLQRRDANGDSVEFFAALPDGTAYTGHGSGISSTEDYVFLTCDDGYLVFDASDLAEAGSDEVVTALDRVDLELTPAFLNIENGTLYVGTFHLLPNYAAPSEHHLFTPDGSENAGIMFAYPAASGKAANEYGFARQAAAVYSLPDRVQGVCQLPTGEFVLSTSYGFNPSHLLSYDLGLAAETAAQGSGQDASSDFTFFVDGRSVPLYFFDSGSLVADVKAPPMTEGIEYHDGRIWVSEESASNKYIFGKLYGAGDVYSLPEICLLD